ncbi:signal-induced proliferation-associated 1-like protein 3 isoform X2 [Hemicordylus capensis]|uniref:signal-induced proliferation-associated 1-like protein 3 isoform X2 n=1 Tax=Hemicordylus capensis TaxID=884348 RepID=UPI0023032591|nr:signal-induced proliferation-associated 1-like protein 3 isoform X2 [Hemicordylus capensis]
MTSYRPVHESGDVAGPGLKGGDYYSPGFWAQNGCASHTDAAPAAGRPATTTPAMPKMGVRARIADWPPKREGLKDPALPSSTSRDLETPGFAARGFQNGQLPRGAAPSSSSSGIRGFQRLARRRSKDAEFPEGWPRSPGRGFLPLRHRSSSEITLSECDLEEALEPRAARLGGSGLPLFREYGSTSSIDVQGVSEQSFYDMLTEFRSGQAASRRPDSSAAARSSRAEGRSEQLLPPLPDEFPLPPKDKARKKGPRAELGSGDSIFRKLRGGRGDGEAGRALPEPEEGKSQEGGRAWLCQKSFAHYDVQSMLFDLNEVAARRAYVAQRRNTATGASAASAGSAAAPPSRAGGVGGPEPLASFISTEDLNFKENLEPDPGDHKSNELLLSCPHFRNEIGGAQERSVGFLRASAGSPGGGSKGAFAEASPAACCTNASVSVLEVPQELQRNVGRLKHYSIEHVDLGARYYQDYFCGKEHSNYFGVDEKLGPVAVSIRREKLEDHQEHGPQYQYRIIFRTSELTTLRGSILEDATPTTTKHGTVRGLPLKDALEYVVPELNTHCLRLALNVPKVTEQLRKLDEQGLCRKHKVGVLYCKASQSSEEEMYNNEEAGPALEEFLALLGEKVSLRGFSKYAAQLDTKTDSTGTHSLYTTCQGYELMFHVSTMLPYTPNNRQQLLRKRHIGNDIVTIIFQEPGALPFTPQNIRSHFQHVFVIVRAQNPCTENVCYSVAVTRSKDVPPFGPAIPSRAVFRKSDLFRDFLLAKVINAENAAHKSDKFHTMATRTRQEYLKDLAENCVTSTTIDSTGKFNLISLTSKKKEKTKARSGAEQYSTGAIAWRILAQDYTQGAEIECILGISNEFVVLLDLATKEVVFNCFCADVIGWTPDTFTIKIFYGRGDHIFVRALESNPDGIKEIVQRLKVMTSGCETVEMTLRRNGLGQLGFHVKFDGTVAEVEDYGFAWQAGLRQGSRLVEICKVAVVTLSHDQMIDWLRTSVTVKVVIIPPHDDGIPRRGWAESFRMSTAEPRVEPESLPVGYQPPHRGAWPWSGSSQAGQWAEQAGHGQSQSLTRTPKQSALAPYRESQPPHGKRPVSFPETPHAAAAASQPGAERGPSSSYRQPSGSFSVPGSSGAAYARYKPSPESSAHRYAAPQRPLVPFDPLYGHEVTSSNGDSSSGGLASQESTMERPKPEPLWHVPVQPRMSASAGSSGSKRPSRQELAGKDSPNRHSKGEGLYSSSHSSSNTLSSNASSSHSEECWFDPADPAEADPDPQAKGGSSDSGIEAATSAKASRRDRLPKASPPYGSTLQEGSKRRELPLALGSGGQSRGYHPKAFGAGAGMPARGASGSHDPFKQPSHSSSRATYPAPVYKTPAADTPRAPHLPQSSSFQLSASVPKSFFSKQSGRNKQLPAGWKRSEETPARPATFTDPKKQVDLSAKNVFGQPRLRASLRDLRSPRKTYKSTIEDDLKKLIIMDSTLVEPERDLALQKPLQRTLSDESLCSGRRDPTYASAYGFEQALPSDVLFTSTLPVRKQHLSPSSGSLAEKKATISASELSLSDVRDKPLRRLDPGLMPLPDTATGLEWSSLVSAAKAYEVQRAVSLFSLNDSVLSPDAAAAAAASPLAHSPVLGHLSLERQPTPHTTPTMSEEPSVDLTGKVFQLEALLKQLHSDLQKEKQDKVVLQAEVAHLRQNNQRLQEESQAANEQLRKFAELFSSAVEKKEL